MTRSLAAAARRAAHRAVEASHRGATAEMLARREAAALLGAAIGLAGRASRAEIRRIARRTSRIVVYYDALWADEGAWEPFAVEGREHFDRAVARGKGVIVVPSHFGRYRWVPTALLDLGAPVTLLVDARNHHLLRGEADRLDPRYRPTLRPDAFETVDASDPASLWQLTRALRGGRVTVMFADGNSGVDGQASPRGAQRVPFLGQEIHVRPGIGALAATSGAAIVPVFLHEPKRHRPVLRFEPPLVRDAGEGAAAFRERAVAALFGTLEREVLRQPWLWEEWWILSRWLAGPPRLPASPPTTPRRFALTMPGLCGRRLHLSRHDLWVHTTGGVHELWDLSRGTLRAVDDELAALLTAAEQGAPALAWVRARPSPPAGLATLRRAIDDGLLELAGG